ncbi:MAG: uracil-DNA glycosylase [Anaerolineales bacterium]|nr:uracil-DNA glycosylase [Anaerolineales bacterium]MCA9974893.1 uracil-DNA glycosylase [Anaerolineales bacterium]
MQFGLFEDRPNYYTSLDELFAVMMNMTDDPLADAGTNVVICRGNPKAKLMIVGEAPGPEENKVGKPFVGRAGQLLDQILQAVNFDVEQDVFISNSVFRLPPGEGGKSFRKPTNEEIEFYKPYLLEIIRLVDPSIILLTGNVATQSLLGLTGITKLRGEWHEWNGRFVMPIFHPSYLLRNPVRTPGSPKALTWKDIQEVRQKYDELMGTQ